MRLAAEHLSKLDPTAIVKHKAVPGRVVFGKPTLPDALVLDSAECMGTPFEIFATDLKHRAQTDPTTLRFLLNVASASQLACTCGLGARCHARALDHFARQAKALHALLLGMGLEDCAWWSDTTAAAAATATLVRSTASAAGATASDALLFCEQHFMCVCRECLT